MAKFTRISFFIISLFLACCGRKDLAPVIDLSQKPEITHNGKHTVLYGETIFSIAFRYDEDYKKIVLWNNLKPPYALEIGQVLVLRPKIKPKNKILPIVPKHVGPWDYPAKGPIIVSFNLEKGHKGINIKGKKGDLVYSSDKGIVAYAGNGLAGYGNLIIIKHNKNYLTAYGNNLQNFVKEGDTVKKGQAIAKMGLINKKYWGVHFELRKLGQPLDPVLYISKNTSLTKR